jgi:hypothetical protein
MQALGVLILGQISVVKTYAHSKIILANAPFGFKSSVTLRF